MNKLFIPIALGIIMILSSCVKVINDDLKKMEPKLVLNAALSPDSTITVNISQTHNVLDDESADNLPFIDSATVKLFENGEYLFDLDNIGAGYYQKAGFYPQIGKSYRATASYGSFKPIEGTTTIPDAVPIIEFDTLMFETTNDYGDNYIEYHTQYLGVLTYQDPEGVSNRYRLSCKIFYTDQDSIYHSYYQYIYPQENDSRFFNNYGGSLFWNDELTDGNETTIRFVFYDAYSNNYAKSGNTQKAHFVFYFQSINKEYYTYLKSLSIYDESGSGEDPFSEPVVIYSNIENGYGIIEGFNEDTTSIDVEVDSDAMIGGIR